MSPDLSTRVRSYAAQLAQDVAHVTVAEVEQRLTDAPVEPEVGVRRQVPGWAVAIAAAAVVLLIVGVVPWLLRSPGVNEPVGPSPPTSVSTPEGTDPETSVTTGPTTTVATVTEVTSDDPRPEADVISPSGWRRWQLDGDVFGSAGVWDLTVGGEGLVAVGTTLVTCEAPGRLVGGVDTSCDAAVWTSTGGVSWRRVTLDAALSRGTSLWKVASSGAGLVAIGRDTINDLPAVWHSPDGFAWSPVTDEDFQDADIHLADVAATSHGFTVVGDEGEDVTTAAVWTSADGLSWTKVPLDEDSSNRASMRALTSSGDQVLAVGILRDDPAHFALWSSTDATAWTLTEVPVGDLGDNDAIGIVAASSGIVVSSYGGVWHSPDGESWSSTSFESLEAGGGCDGDGLQVFDLATAGTEFTATGYRCESTGMVAAVWTSPDGANWSITSDNSETFAGGITTFEPAGSGLIAFGSDPLEPDGPDDPASTNTVLWTNVATDPTATQTTTTDSPEDGIQELGWSGDLPPLEAAQSYRTGSAGLSEPAFPVIAFTIPTDGWFGSYSSCYDRVEGVNLTSPHPGKLWIGTGLLLDHSEASLTAPQMRADLETSPEFRIDSAEAVTVAGLPAQRLSITLLADTTYFTQFDFGHQYADNSWIPLPRARQPATIWLIETGDADHADVIVLAASQPDVHQAFTDDTQRLVDSVGITSGPTEQCGS